MAMNDQTGFGLEFLRNFTPPKRQHEDNDKVLGEIDARRRQLGMSWDRAAAEYVLEHQRRIAELEEELDGMRDDAAYWEQRADELRKKLEGKGAP